MQILLQDFTDYWPMMGQLSPVLRRELQHEIVPLVPIIVSLATALIVAGVTMLLKIGTAAYISMFLFALAPLLMRLESRRSDPGAANIEYGKLKVSWQGGLALGCLVCGLLLAILSIGILIRA
jgi:hypothetical protein